MFMEFPIHRRDVHYQNNLILANNRDIIRSSDWKLKYVISKLEIKMEFLEVRLIITELTEIDSRVINVCYCSKMRLD